MKYGNSPKKSKAKKRPTVGPGKGDNWMGKTKGGKRTSAYSAPENKVRAGKSSPRHFLGGGAAGKAADAMSKRHQKMKEY